MSFMYMVVARVCHMQTQLARYSYLHGFKLGWCMGVSNKDMNVNRSTDYTPFVSLIATPPPPYGNSFNDSRAERNTDSKCLNSKAQAHAVHEPWPSNSPLTCHTMQ